MAASFNGHVSTRVRKCTPSMRKLSPYIIQVHVGNKQNVTKKTQQYGFMNSKMSKVVITLIYVFFWLFFQVYSHNICIIMI